MRVVTEEQHRVLAFIAACNASGLGPTPKQVSAWLADAPTVMGPTTIGMMSGAGSLSLGGLLPQPVAMPERLLRMGWVETRRGALWVTDLGAALYRAAERADAEEPASATVILGADDPLAYASLMAELAAARRGLLVDPYLRREQVFQLVQDTTIARLLISKKIDRKGTAQLDEIRAFIRNIPPGRAIEVRVAEEAHDRYLKTEDGKSFMIGSSLNMVQLGKATTVITPIGDLGAEAISDLLEAEWDRAEPLRPVSADEDKIEGDETEASG